MNKFLAYAVILDSLMLVYVQCVIMLKELQNVLSQELIFLCSKTTSPIRMMHTKTIDVSLLHFYRTRNTYIV